MISARREANERRAQQKAKRQEESLKNLWEIFARKTKCEEKREVEKKWKSQFKVIDSLCFCAFVSSWDLAMDTK